MLTWEPQMYWLSLLLGDHSFLEENKWGHEQNDKFKTTKKIMSYQFDKKELMKCKYWSFLKAPFSHKPWLSQSGHFFVIFGILGNLP